MTKKFGVAGGVAGILGKEVVGETIEGGFRLAAAGITATGTAVAGALNAAGTALGGALQGAMTPAPTTIVNNVGMVGESAKKKVVSGSGTIPAPKKSAKPAVNPNMPTEKLLVIAVKYLTSIDKTLQDQINFERLALERQAQAEKEAAIESGGTNAFSRLGDKLGAIKDKASDKASDAASLAKKLLAGTALAGLGFMGLGALTTEQAKLEELKKNWDAFQVEYKWLLDFAKYLGAGAVGSRFGGVPGAIAGIVLTYLGDRGLFDNVPIVGDILGNRGDATGGASSPPGAIGAGITAGIAGYAGYRGVKTVRDVRSRLGTMAQQRAAPRVAPSLAGSGFRDPRTGRIVSRQAAAAGGGWLSGPKGQRFVAFLSRRFGKTYIAKKVFPFLARVFAGVAITATGVGAIPGILWTLVNVGLSIWTVYDLITAYWDWTEEEKLRKDAEAVNNSTTAPDATAVPPAAVGNAPTAVSKSESGKPEEAMSFFTSPEGGSWTKEQAAGIVANLVQESRLDPNITGDGGKAYGLAQWHADRQANFQRVFNKSIHGSTFQEQLQFVNWELNNTEAAAGRALRGASTADEATRIVSEKYERAGTPMMERRLGNASALMAGDYAAVGSSGGYGGSASALAGSAADLTSEGMKAFGGIIKGIGKQIVGERTYTPMSAQTADNAKAIADASSRIETAMNFGTKKDDKSQKLSTVFKSLSKATPTNTIQAIDPTYGGGDVITKYLQYHKLATPKAQAGA